MKTKQELLSMLFARLAELQDGSIKVNSESAEKLRIELSLLYNILGEEVPEEYWDAIENEIYDMF